MRMVNRSFGPARDTQWSHVIVMISVPMAMVGALSPQFCGVATMNSDTQSGC